VDDYAIEDLMRLSGYSARGIRHYIQLGLLARPKLAGSATRYSRETLGRLAAIRFWRDKDGVSVRRIKRELRALEPEEVEVWANDLDPVESADTSPVVEAPAQGQAEAPLTAQLESVERWVRVPLVRGLDLVMREGAGAEVVELAREIQQKYGAVHLPDPAATGRAVTEG
jgi:DNA-binding transcriptional MerR regulator